MFWSSHYFPPYYGDEHWGILNLFTKGALSCRPNAGRETRAALLFFLLSPQANWIKVRRKIFEKFFTYFLFLTEEFWKEMDKAWNSITKEELRKYINTMPDRCKAVIAAKGGHTRYWFYSQTYSLYIKLHLQKKKSTTTGVWLAAPRPKDV